MQISAEVRAYLALVVDLLGAVAWPITLAFVLVKFRDIIAGAVGRSKELILKIAGAEIKLTGAEAADALSDLFAELDTVLDSHLTAEERAFFLRVLSLPRVPTVSELLPDFQRNTPEHKMLRALRGVYFIRPSEGGPWQANKHVQVTTLGRIVAQHKRDRLMAGPPEGGVTLAAPKTSV